MPVTYSATPMGSGAQPYRSVVRNSLISIQLATFEVLTLVHRLGACPTEIRCMLRSTLLTDSGIPLAAPQVISMNASQAVLNFGRSTTTPETYANIDIISEVTHSIVA